MRLLDEKSVSDFLEIPPVVWKLKEIAHRADYIRFALLKTYGGVWLDSDIILLRNLEDAIEPHISQYDFVGYGREPGKPSIGFMACRKGCRLVYDHYCKVRQHLQHIEKKRPLDEVGCLKLGWTEIGFNVLWPLAAKYGYFHHPFHMFAPTYFSDSVRFSDTRYDISQYLSQSPFAVMLYNKMMSKKYSSLSERELLYGDTLISAIYRRALGIEDNF